MNSRRTVAARIVVAGLAVIAFVVRPTSAATVSGVENGQYGEHQAFAVQRNPAFPTCSSGSSYDSFTVTRNAGSASNPYSDATNGPVALGSNYLKVVPSGDSNAPWGLAMFNSSNQELRWNGSAWVTAPGGGFTTEKPFTETGQIYGASNEGFLHNSGAGAYGTFISPNSVLVSSRTYTPDASLNVCTSSQAIAANLGNLQVSNSTVVPTSSTSPTTSTSSSTTTSTTSTSTTTPSSTTSTTAPPPPTSTPIIAGSTTTTTTTESGVTSGVAIPDELVGAEVGDGDLSASGFDLWSLMAVGFAVMVTGMTARRTRSA